MGAKFADSVCADRRTDILRCYSERLCPQEKCHDARIIHRNFSRNGMGHIFQHADHRWIIMSENIQLEKTSVQLVVIIVGGNDRRCHIIGRMLNRRKIIDIMIGRNDQYSAGMLTGCSLDLKTAGDQIVDLGIGTHSSMLFQIMPDHTVCGLLCQSSHGTGTINMIFTEHFTYIGMSLGLIFSGEVQIDIRFLIPVKSQENFKGDLLSVLFESGTADRTIPFRQVKTAHTGNSPGFFGIKVCKMTFRAIIMRFQRIDFRNACHRRCKR